jgi:hypothetical protein
MSQPSVVTPAVDLSARDRHARLKAASATPAERLAAMRAIMERSWAVLLRNPQAIARFRRRNFKARAIQSDDGQRGHGT